MNLFLSTVVGIILNCVSVYLYRAYIRERKRKDNSYSTRVTYSRNQEPNQAITSNDDEIKVVVVARAKKLTRKEMNEKRAEKNMFLMALTLCSLSILSRVLIFFTYILFFFSGSFSTNLLVYFLNMMLPTIVPSIAIFVFYAFNKMFREEFRKKFITKETSNSNQIEVRN